MPTLEERVRMLEEKVAELQGECPEQGKLPPWWKKWFGAFRDDPDFDAVVQTGVEYRRSQPNPADNPDAIDL